jgi:uncharacterized protein DUF1003
MTADRDNYGGSTMARSNPGPEGSGASPPQQQPPEPSERSAGSGGPAPGAGDGRHPAPSGAGQRHPAILEVEQQRLQNVQLRVADWITGFAGSMNFVYLHVALFAVWMLLIERSPWPTLTLIVSLEAIFLSTFVMIGQNRQAAFQQAKADHDFTEQELELKTNTQLTREIHVLTAELHKRLIENPARQQS